MTRTDHRGMTMLNARANEIFSELSARNHPDNFELLRQHAQWAAEHEAADVTQTFGRRDGTFHGTAVPTGDAAEFRGGSGPGYERITESREERAEHLARVHEIPFLAAVELADFDEQIRELESPSFGAGEPGCPWTDARPRRTPADPTSDRDYQVDQLRAAKAGYGRLSHATWRAAAVEGQDIVGLHFEAERVRKLNALRAERERRLDSALATEAAKQADAHERELNARALKALVDRQPKRPSLL